jgi:signal transduction histidine kinase
MKIEQNDPSYFNIVAVDDMEANLNLIKAAFSKSTRFKFEFFTSGLKAYTYLNKNANKVDLVLLDIMLDHTNGLEICQQLKKNSEFDNIPIILITAKTTPADVVKGFESGAFDYISKPFNLSELRVRVNNALKMREMQHCLEIRNKKLEELNEIKDFFLSTTSHDIRNNLTGIIGHCYLILMQKYGNINSKYLQSLNVILRRSKTISNLLDNIVDASRIESGKLVLNIMKTDFYDFITQYYQDIYTLYNYENLNFNLDVDEKISEVYMDSEKIDEVLTNLVSNAVKFTPDGGNITIGAKEYDSNYIQCFVKDTGYGINKKDLPNIFEKFNSVEQDKKKKYKIKSSGLGLSICKGIIERHKCKIWVESEENKETTFYFTLPKNECTN